MAPHARVGQPRGAAIPSLVLYTMGVPGTYHSICNTRGVCQDGAGRPPSTAFSTRDATAQLTAWSRCVTPELRDLLVLRRMALFTNRLTCC